MKVSRIKTARTQERFIRALLPAAVVLLAHSLLPPSARALHAFQCGRQAVTGVVQGNDFIVFGGSYSETRIPLTFEKNLTSPLRKVQGQVVELELEIRESGYNPSSAKVLRISLAPNPGEPGSAKSLRMIQPLDCLKPKP